MKKTNNKTFYNLENCVRKMLENKDEDRRFKEIMTVFRIGRR